MASPNTEEFYVGYRAEASSSISRIVRRIVIVLFLSVAITSVALVVGQNEFARSFFEYGTTRDFDGILSERPLPALLVERPNAPQSSASHSRYTLVGEGKHGASVDVKGLDGRKVRLRGRLIYRDGLTMIEVLRGAIEVIPSDRERKIGTNSDWLGVQTLTGEIVDSKCYLGVMNPGNRTTHRECAVRCISGGIPPLFVVRNGAGETAALWLISSDGSSVGAQVLDLVAEPIEITGEVTRDGDQLFLRADPRTYRAISGKSVGPDQCCRVTRS